MKISAGLYDPEPLLTLPSEVNTFLSAHKNPTADDIINLFGEQPESLNLNGITFDEASGAAFCDELARNMTVEALALRGSSGLNMVNVLTALVENLSVRRVDLSQCSLGDAAVEAMANSLIPYNRTIIEWNLSENPLQEKGIKSVVSALEKTASVQRLSIRNTIGDGPLADVDGILESFKNLPCLYQIDVTGNGMLKNRNAITEMKVFFEQNLRLLHPAAQVNVRPAFADAAPPTPQASPPPENKTPTRTRSATGRQSMLAQRNRSTSSRQLTGSPTARTRNATIKREARPSMVGSPTRNRASSRPPQEKQQEPAPQTQTQTQEPAKEEPKPETRPRANTPEPKQQPQRTDSPRRTQSPRPQRQPSQTSTPRGRSPAPYSATRARSSTPIMKDIDDGYEAWKQVKDEYNRYIRDPSGSATPTPINRTMPKYCLGKRVDAISRPSPVFQPGVARTRERAPTPEERRKYAPWNQKGEESTRGTEVVIMKAGYHGRDPQYVRIVDGGDITSISDDPRDIGYQTRKLKSGNAMLKPTSAFCSNSARDMRFGTSGAAEVIRQAQAPGPGFYTQADEWERRAEKLREQSRQKHHFGYSTAPRANKVEKNDDPGPGFYEIP